MSRTEPYGTEVEELLEKVEKDAGATIDAFLQQIREPLEGLTGTVQTEADAVRQRLDQLTEHFEKVGKDAAATIDASLQQIREPVEGLAGAIQTEADAVRQQLDRLTETMARHDMELEKIKATLTRFEDAQKRWGPKNAGWLLTALIGTLIVLQLAVLWLVLVR